MIVDPNNILDKLVVILVILYHTELPISNSLVHFNNAKLSFLVIVIVKKIEECSDAKI